MTAPFDVPEADRASVESWWSHLADEARAEITELTAPEQDDIALQRQPDRWEALPVRVVARFVDPQDQRDHDRAIRDLTEYINAHPGIPFYLRQRTFHVCRAHARARQVLRDGWIPATFVCPFGRKRCPFESALQERPGSSIRLVTERRLGSAKPATRRTKVR